MISFFKRLDTQQSDQHQCGYGSRCGNQFIHSSCSMSMPGHTDSGLRWWCDPNGQYSTLSRFRASRESGCTVIEHSINSGICVCGFRIQFILDQNFTFTTHLLLCAHRKSFSIFLFQSIRIPVSYPGRFFVHLTDGNAMLNLTSN